MTLTLDKKRQIAWMILFAIAITGIVLMFIDCYSRSDSEIQRGNNGLDSNGHSIIGSPDNKAWHERLIFPFYFTFQSNMLAVIIGFVRILGLIKKKSLLRRLEIFMAVNLLVTMLVYWLTLFPKHTPDTSVSWTSNLVVHLITPLLAIGTFLFETVRNKTTHFYKGIWRQAAFNLSYLLIWVIIAIVIYFSLGAVHSAAIYHFMDLIRNPWYETLIYIVAIPVVYYLFTVLAIWISNPKRK